MSLDSQTYNAVKSIFNNQGVPDYVWLSIAQYESSLNPNAVGDNGASIGLFQLNTKGGQGTGYSPGYLSDPVINAEIASRAIAPAYRQVQGKYPTSAIAGQVAIRSGHPGGTVANPLTGQSATSAVDTINQYANAFLSGQAAGPQVSSGTSSSGSSGGGIIPNPLDALSGVNAFFNDLISAIGSIDIYGLTLGGLGIIILLVLILVLITGWATSEDSPVGKVAQAAAKGAL